MMDYYEKKGPDTTPANGMHVASTGGAALLKTLVTLVKQGLALTVCWIILMGTVATAEASGREKEEIVVGTHLPLSGIFSQIGKEQQWAYEASVRDVNIGGGIYVGEYDRRIPVKLVILDDQSSPAVVVTVVQRLIAEHRVDFLLSGHTAVHGVVPGSIIAEINKTYYHATGSFIQPWQEHNFHWSTLLFVDMAKTAAVPYELWQSLPRGERPKRVALMMEDVYAGLAFGSMLRKKAEEFGYQVVYDKTVASAKADYSGEIATMKELQVDAVLVYNAVADSVTFIRQVKESRLPLKFLMGWRGTWPAEFGRIMGPAAENVISDGHWSEEYPYAGAKELGARYRAEFGRPSTSVGAFYALAQVLWQAIEQAGGLHPALVRHQVLKGTFHTVLGTITYNHQGIGHYPPLAFQWTDGLPEVVYPLDRATHKVRSPLSNDLKKD
jgi:branched-chain amino acid transport system substrate-binding protein